MSTPESKPIHVALAAIMADVRSLAKADRNTHFGFNFRGIDATLNAIGPAMRTHGVVVLPQVEQIDYRDVQTSKGKPAREVTVRVRYRFIGPQGDTLDVVTVGESMDEADKGTAKAMSVAMRIALLQTFALPTDDADPDASDVQRGPHQNHHPQRQAQPQRPATAPPPTPEPGSADAARARLRQLCEERGRDLAQVAHQFAAEHDGLQLREATDPLTITQFTATIRDAA